MVPQFSIETVLPFEYGAPPEGFDQNQVEMNPNEKETEAGAVYVGEWKKTGSNPVRHGRGKQKMEDGSSYEGRW